MKSLFLVCLLVVSSLAQSNGTKTVPPTSVAGESWLNHLHRSFQETSMGKTGRLGPPNQVEREGTPEWQSQLASDSSKQSVPLRGSDLYRLNCWGCHGEFGLGAPPEINSVINPTRASSAQLVMERMKSRGMDISRADATELAKQSKAALLERLHKGGTDMPAFPHLSEPEVHAILAYLKQLAGVPGAEKQQATINESGARIGEQIVKSTCHICHNAAGPNPNQAQLFNGVIPPLSTLTTRTSLSKFERKVRSGAPIVMGTPPSVCRGRMPVFYYLSEAEVASAYLYLRIYPPASTVFDPATPALESKQAANKVFPVAFSAGRTDVAPSENGLDLSMTAFEIGAGTSAALLLAGGLWFTLREIRRLTGLNRRGRSFVLVDGRLGQLASQTGMDRLPLGNSSEQPSTTNEATFVNVAGQSDKEPFHHDDYRRFERSWLLRWVEGEDDAENEAA